MMSVTPGRPHEATVHPRTTPAADSIARRARTTSDWFRHDGTNVEPPAAPPTRHPDPRTEVNAARNRGEPDQWFEHHAEVVQTEAPPGGRGLVTDSGRACAVKVGGQKEEWYAHDDNRDYVSPHPPPKLKGDGAVDNRHNFADVDSNDWYKAHKGPDVAVLGEPLAAANEGAARAESAVWEGQGAGPEPPAHARLMTADAESYLDRNRAGSAVDWFSHHDDVETARYAATPRVTTAEGQMIACRNRGESDDWFSYTPRGNSSKAPPTGGVGGIVPAMGPVTQREAGGGQGGRVKPEAEDNAQRNMQGMMEKFLKEDAGYASARPVPRVRPEAGDAAQRNRGTMYSHLGGGVASSGGGAASSGGGAAGSGTARSGAAGSSAGRRGGYPDPVAVSRDAHSRVRPEARQFAERNKGTAGLIMYEGGAGGGGDAPPSGGRRRRPEAADNAARNQGSLQGLLNGIPALNLHDSATPQKPPSRLQSGLARQFAERNRGTVGSLLNPGT